MVISFKKMNGNYNRTEDEDTNTNNQEAVKSSSSGEYYAKGCAELATESALTLAKIEHVSRIWGLGGGGGYSCSCSDEDSPY